MIYSIYNTKPVSVRAIKFNGNNVTQLRVFMDGASHQFRLMSNGLYELDVPTPGGFDTVYKDNYLTCDEEGLFHVWTDEKFNSRFQDTGETTEIK